MERIEKVTFIQDFYFVYGYDQEKRIADRLYRLRDSQFERYNPKENNWEAAPEQACIFIGEDWEYEEISEEKVKELKVLY